MNDAIINMYLEGQYSMADVGRSFGITRQRVHQILQKEGVEQRWLKQKSKDKEAIEKYGKLLEIALDRYRKGEYLFVVAEELGIPHAVVDRFTVRTEADKKAHEVAKFSKHTKVGDIPDGFDSPCIEWTGSYSNGIPIHLVNTHDRSARKWGYFYATGNFLPVRGLCGNKACVSHLHTEPK